MRCSGAHDNRAQENKARRVSVVFGADRVLEFCAANDIDVIVRAHQCGTSACSGLDIARALTMGIGSFSVSYVS